MLRTFARTAQLLTIAASLASLGCLDVVVSGSSGRTSGGTATNGTGGLTSGGGTGGTTTGGSAPLGDFVCTPYQFSLSDQWDAGGNAQYFICVRTGWEGLPDSGISVEFLPPGIPCEVVEWAVSEVHSPGYNGIGTLGITCDVEREPDWRFSVRANSSGYDLVIERTWPLDGG